MVEIEDPVHNTGGAWLVAGDKLGVESMMHRLGWLKDEEKVGSAERAGEGNMNLTLRVTTSQRSLILKQSRPWVEKYPQIEAPVERANVEAEFYRRVGDVPGVGSMMPTLIAADDGAHVLLLEDLGGGGDFSALYCSPDASGEPTRVVDEALLDGLSGYLANLHSATRGTFSEGLANRAMRKLNHEHMFVVPFERENGVDLQALEPGLQDAADEVREDHDLLEQVERLGDRYLEDGPCLLHGDFFPGSWMTADEANGSAIRIIDPEFCFFGDPEFDVAVALAHLLLARQGDDVMAKWLDATFASAGEPLDTSLVAEFAGIEVLRRLLGVAQLPIGSTSGLRALWLARGAAAVRSGVIASLLA